MIWRTFDLKTNQQQPPLNPVHEQLIWYDACCTSVTGKLECKSSFVEVRWNVEDTKLNVKLAGDALDSQWVSCKMLMSIEPKS